MKVSKKEQQLTERIFNLKSSLKLLDYGFYPLHEEAKRVLRAHINNLMKTKL